MPRPCPAGTAFIDPGGSNVHTALTPTARETVVIATFYDAPVQGPLTLPVPASRQRSTSGADSTTNR